MTNQELRKLGYTHTISKKGEGRAFYYSLTKRRTVSAGDINSGSKVYSNTLSKELNKDEVISRFNQKTKSIDLMKKEYTHVKYNRYYYNIKEKRRSQFKDIEDIKSIKVFCNETKKDITEKSINSLKKSFIDYGIQKSKTPRATNELRENNFTHKRCFNRKLYDLANSCYVNIKNALLTPDLKIYDEKSTNDITSIYKENYDKV